MQLINKHLILLACVFVLYPFTAYGESGLDFIFKDPSRDQDVMVDEIRSADTIILRERTGEKREVIKLIGLRAPEAPKNRKVDLDRDQYGFVKKEKASPLTPIEEQAFDFAKELLEGQRVRLEFDSEKKGEDYSTLAYVFLLDNELFVNAEILRQGFAFLQIRPPNTKYSKELREAYTEARLEKRGLQGE
jgi:micrococcal nuclease